MGRWRAHRGTGSSRSVSAAMGFLAGSPNLGVRPWVQVPGTLEISEWHGLRIGMKRAGWGLTVGPRAPPHAPQPEEIKSC